MFNERTSFNKRLEEIVDEINTDLGFIEADEMLKVKFDTSDFLDFPAIVCYYFSEGDVEKYTNEFSSMIQLSLYVRNEDVRTLTYVMKELYLKFGFVSANINEWVTIVKKDYFPCIEPYPTIECMRLQIMDGWQSIYHADKEIRHYKLDLKLFYNL